MKRILLVMILAVAMLFVVSEAQAQFKAATMESSDFNMTIAPYGEVKLFSSNEDADPLLKAGVELSANNWISAVTTYLKLEWAKIDTRAEEFKQCPPGENCIWPNSFFHNVDNAQTAWTVFLGSKLPVQFLGK